MPPPHAAVPSMPAFVHRGVCDCSAALPRSARLDGITSGLLNIPEAEQENERGSNRQKERKGNEGRAEMTALVNLPFLLASSLGNKEGRAGEKGDMEWKRGQQKVERRKGRRMRGDLG